MLTAALALFYDPTSQPFTLFLVQLALIVALVRVLCRLFSKVRLPFVVGEIIAGIILGPSAFGQIPGFTNAIFPANSLRIIEIVAEIGLMLFMFHLGLEIDYRQMQKSTLQSIPIAIGCVAISFASGATLSLWLWRLEPTSADYVTYLLFIGTALSYTAFSVLARILSSAKLLASPVGGQAVACAAAIDLVAWCMLALTLSYSAGGSALNGLYVALFTCAILLFIIFIVKPFLARLHRHVLASPNNQRNDRTLLAIILLLLCTAAAVSQMLGVEALAGSFTIGIIVPKEAGFAKSFATKIELLIMELLLPLYFVSSGLRTNITTLDDFEYWAALFVVIIFGSIAKILPAVVISRYAVRLNRHGELFSRREAKQEIAGGEDLVPALHVPEPIDIGSRMPWRQCLTVGVLMNTRGLVGLIVLNIGHNANIISQRVFTIFILFTLFTIIITPPILDRLYSRSYHLERASRRLKRQHRHPSQLHVSKLSVGVDESHDSLPPQVEPFQPNGNIDAITADPLHPHHHVHPPNQTQAIHSQFDLNNPHSNQRQRSSSPTPMSTGLVTTSSRSNSRIDEHIDDLQEADGPQFPYDGVEHIDDHPNIDEQGDDDHDVESSTHSTSATPHAFDRSVYQPSVTVGPRHHPALATSFGISSPNPISPDANRRAFINNHSHALMDGIVALQHTDMTSEPIASPSMNPSEHNSNIAGHPNGGVAENPSTIQLNSSPLHSPIGNEESQLLAAQIAQFAPSNHHQHNPYQAHPSLQQQHPHPHPHPQSFYPSSHLPRAPSIADDSGSTNYVPPPPPPRSSQPFTLDGHANAIANFLLGLDAEHRHNNFSLSDALYAAQYGHGDSGISNTDDSINQTGDSQWRIMEEEEAWRDAANQLDEQESDESNYQITRRTIPANGYQQQFHPPTPMQCQMPPMGQQVHSHYRPQYHPHQYYPQSYWPNGAQDQSNLPVHNHRSGFD